jgi:hypothetical protein
VVVCPRRAGHPPDGLRTEKALHRPEISVAVQQSVAALDTKSPDNEIDRPANRKPLAGDDFGCYSLLFDCSGGFNSLIARNIPLIR